jgi:hypothetical protein
MGDLTIILPSREARFLVSNSETKFALGSRLDVGSPQASRITDLFVIEWSLAIVMRSHVGVLRTEVRTVGSGSIVSDISSESNMQVSREPVSRAKVSQNLTSSDTTKSSILGIKLETVLLLEESAVVTELFDALRPIVRETDIDLGANLKQFANVELTHMIDRLDIIFVVRKTLKVWFAVVVPLPDTRHAGDAKRAKADSVGRAKEVDVGCNPTAVVEFEQMVAGLMISSDE